MHTDEGLSGLSEIFSVPPGVARAVLDGPDSFFGRQLVGQDPIPPERLRTRLYNSMLHGNRRGWAVMCIGAVDVALWDIYGQAVGRPVYELLGGAERSRHQVVNGSGDGREVVPYGTIVSTDWDRDERAAAAGRAGGHAARARLPGGQDRADELDPGDDRRPGAA